MKLKLICIGKTQKPFLLEGEEEYLKRLKHYISVEKIEIPDLKKAKNLTQEQIKIAEGLEFMSKIMSTDILVLLDENGQQFTSLEFSEYLQNQMNQGLKTIVFLIGGAYGFSDAIYQRAQQKIALSKMTFSHQMIRMIFFEQIYRGMTILKGEPYHHS